mmetsp:Transcript_128798/g.223349  ORF Transcript_128798/g.223349 Transcript_128798/m.223349 type:complete len:259 (-) Transcript_128798:69-845(-)
MQTLDETAPIDDASLEGLNDSCKFVRTITQDTEGTEVTFSEGGFSRLVTEDVCPTLSKGTRSTPTHPRSVELVLESDPSSVSTAVVDVTDMVLDLREILSEAAGEAIESVSLVLPKSRSTLTDYDAIPSPVIVRGLEAFPSSKAILGRAHFLQILGEVKDIISNAMSSHSGVESHHPFIEGIILESHRPLNPQMSVRSIFGSVGEMNVFYRSSVFCTDPMPQLIYSELNTLLGHSGKQFFEFVGCTPVKDEIPASAVG